MGVQNLILFRHAKAEDPIEAPSDEDRALTPAGRAAALQQARQLQALGAMPDRAIVSPAVRTRQTCDAAREAFPDMAVSLVDGLYLAPPQTILNAVSDAGNSTAAGTILVIGHNPGLHLLACDLIAGGDTSQQAGLLLERFKTAEIAWFIADDASRSGYTLLHFLTRGR